MKKTINFLLLVFLSLLFSNTALADSWALPNEKEYCSENNKFCFKVIPKKLESQLNYFKDRVAGKENAGADKNTKENYCKGEFFERNEKGKLIKKWSKKLVNEVSPVSAIISNDGKYIVTFDNWHNVGYGDHVVAIYSSQGEVIKKFGLDYFLTKDDISQLPTSVSSIWWHGRHWIDEKKKELVLEVVESEKDKKYFQLRFDLSNGKLLDEKRNRLPHLAFVIEAIKKLDENQLAYPNTTPDKVADECFADQSNFVAVSSEELLNHAVTKEIPHLLPAAKALRVSGIVVAEILVNKDGKVECARITAGHPLLRGSVLTGIKNWKFEKTDRNLLGKIVFELRWGLVAPDGTILK